MLLFGVGGASPGCSAAAVSVLSCAATVLPPHGHVFAVVLIVGFSDLSVSEKSMRGS